MENDEGRGVTVLLLKKGKKNLFSKAQAVLKRTVEEGDGEIDNFSGYALYFTYFESIVGYTNVCRCL